MKSFKDLCLPGALVAFLIAPCISSAATVFSLQDLITAKTMFLNEGGLDHDLLNPLQITISNATWSAGSVGDFRITEAAGSANLSDLIRFVNVGGVANIFFGSDSFGLIPLTGPLSGPSPGFTTTFAETTPASSFPAVLQTTNLFTVNAAFFSDTEVAGSVISDSITLTATPPGIPEPSTFALAGLGALGLLIKSFRRRK